jgi:hypothetical protein
LYHAISLVFAIRHSPISTEFERLVNRVMPELVDCDIGLKVAPTMISLGFLDVRVEIEADKIFTVIGSIDSQRRWNWERQFQSARPHLVRIMGSEADADHFVQTFLSYYDDPTTSSVTALHFTKGRVG